MNDTQKQIDGLLAAWNIQFSASLIGETIKDNNWTCDEWRIKIGAMRTSYYTGTVAYANWERANLQPVAPCAADVVHSLFMDGEATGMSFDEWCENCGFDSDSRKAFNTYEQCCVIGKDLRKVFTAKQRAELSELLQDY